MEKRFIGFGLVSGLLAGVISFVFARVFIEPQVQTAISYEQGRSHAELALSGGHEHEHEMFTRSVQENIGAGVGSLAFAIALGAMFAVAFTVLWAYLGRRYPSTDPRWVAAGTAAAAFVAICAVPQFIYPANPPAVGEADTIGSRSASYLVLTLASLALMIVAVAVALWLRPRIGGLASATLGAIGYLAGIGIVVQFLPRFDEVPRALLDQSGSIVYQGFPAQTLALFRTYSVMNQALLWTVIAIVFAAALRRFTTVRGSAAPESALSRI
ncbi:CbtA family protein [Gordonia sp. TBRC 11910]|uniref:CbtA family protein n=1 Tax=Gordonia asplenii TaxID=2725283 RepID=A0A848L2N9_9ACTN|nr:CbtA family protein [Gordonia asplenii]NMO02873.1 CbtA family protein [Gordonia asplenii]